MKKLTLTLVLLLMFAIGIFADDGQTPGGNKNCPNGQTVCREIPVDDDTFIKTFTDFLISFFI